jgi:hypothetical protein
LYYGAPTSNQFQTGWVNRYDPVAAIQAVVGVLTDDQVLKDYAKRQFKEWVKFGTWPNGTGIDEDRWGDGNPFSWNGFQYPVTALSTMSCVADVLARDGDSSLYEYETNSGLHGTNVTSGDPKSLLNIIKHSCKQIDGTIVEYGSLVDDSNPAYIITMPSDMVIDSYFTVANMYYQDSYVHDIYMRTASGTDTRNPNPIDAGGFDPYGGDWGCLPNVMFMYADLEGQIDPYGG